MLTKICDPNPLANGGVCAMLLFLFYHIIKTPLIRGRKCLVLLQYLEIRYFMNIFKWPTHSNLLHV